MKTGGACSAAPVVGVIVLAAGASRRMGARNKLLVEIDGRPMVRCVVESALGAGLAPLLVVTGFEAERVEAALADTEATLVHNHRHAEGMGASLAAGARAMPGGVDAALVALADMPFVSMATLETLKARFSCDGGAGIWVPVFEGRHGHPVLFSSDYFGALGELGGDEGARRLLGAAGSRVHPVPVADPGVIRDIDREGDL